MHPTIPEEHPDVDHLDDTSSPARKGSPSKSQRIYLDIPSAKYVEIEQAVNPVRLQQRSSSKRYYAKIWTLLHVHGVLSHVCITLGTFTA